MISVQFPEMRREVIFALKALSDPEYQQRVWIDHLYPKENYYDDLDQNVSILYDDTQVVPDPSSRVGTILVDDDEVDRLTDLTRALDPIIEKLGNVPDIEYVSDPDWRRVVEAARAAHSAMTASGKEFS